MVSFRKEFDSVGAKSVPTNAYYGAFTQRALDTFTVSGLTTPKHFIDSIVEIKIAAAHANERLRLLDERIAHAIVRAGNEILAGKFNTQFGLDFFQAGAGTPFNMNVNEVIANRANEFFGKKKGTYSPVHPNNHVNLSQSTNDVIPTALRLTLLKMLPSLLRELSVLQKLLKQKSMEFRSIIKSARTHLQDAVPITLGQEFAAYSIAIERNIVDIKRAEEKLRGTALGGTAVGTGLNAHPKYCSMVLQELRKVCRLKLKTKKNLVEATQFYSDFLAFSHSLTLLSVDLEKIANDLRLLASGPNTGFNEIALPVVEPGSSIMPGKVNPSVPEMLNMVCFQVQGNNLAIEKACSAAQLELNIFAPLVAKNLFESTALLSNALFILNSKCIKGVKANKQKCRQFFLNSSALATLLSPILGYDAAAKIAKESTKQGKGIEEIILEKKILSKQQIKNLFNPRKATKPNLSIKK